jgi:hypothetical protein
VARTGHLTTGHQQKKKLPLFSAKNNIQKLLSMFLLQILKQAMYQFASRTKSGTPEIWFWRSDKKEGAPIILSLQLSLRTMREKDNAELCKTADYRSLIL